MMTPKLLLNSLHSDTTTQHYPRPLTTSFLRLFVLLNETL